MKRELRALRRAVVRAWDEEPITWWACLLLLPGMVLSDTLNAAHHGCAPWLAFLIGMCSWTLMVCFLLAWRRLLLLSRPGRACWRTRVSVGYMIAGTVRWAYFAGVVTACNPTSDLAALLIPKTVSTMLWLSLAAVVVDWQRRSTQQIARLEAEYRRLVHTRARILEALRETSDELRRARRDVTNAISHITARLHPRMSDTEIETVTGQIAEINERRVRPASQRLHRVSFPFELPNGPSPRLTLRQKIEGTLAAWPVAAPFAPATVLAFAVPMSAAGLLAGLPLRSGDLVTIFGIAAEIAILYWAATACLPVVRRSPRPIRLPIVLAVYCIILAIGVAAVWLAADLATPRQFGLPLFLPLLPTGVAFCAGIAAARKYCRRAAEAEAADVVTETTRSVQRARQHLWAERRRVAIILHGRVQAALTASEILLRRYRHTSSSPERMKMIERVNELLVKAALIEMSPPTADFSQRVAELANLWQGIMLVTVDLEPAADCLVSAHPDSTDAATEVLREILLNAVRHGQAEDMHISIRQSGACSVLLDVTERRPAYFQTARSGDSGVGLGTELMDSLALRWEAAEGPGSRRTTLELLTGPVGPLPAAATSARVGIASCS